MHSNRGLLAPADAEIKTVVFLPSLSQRLSRLARKGNSGGQGSFDFFCTHAAALRGDKGLWVHFFAVFECVADAFY
jgi:hypothetical protein